MVVAGKAQSEKEGVEMARQSIASGGAKKALEAFRKASSEFAKQEADLPTGLIG